MRENFGGNLGANGLPMGKDLNIPQGKINSALLFTLIEIYSQNCVMTEMFAKMYSITANEELTIVLDECRKNFQNQKNQFQSILQSLYGHLDLKDILGDDAEKGGVHFSEDSPEDDK